MVRVLFVCLGNICRSPAAEAVMTSLVEDEGLASEITCDSAGTAGYHQGEKADRRMRQRGQARGYAVTSISRRVSFPEDFESFDYIVGMDASNMRDLHDLDADDQYKDKLFL